VGFTKCVSTSTAKFMRCGASRWRGVVATRTRADGGHCRRRRCGGTGLYGLVGGSSRPFLRVKCASIGGFGFRGISASSLSRSCSWAIASNRRGGHRPNFFDHRGPGVQNSRPVAKGRFSSAFCFTQNGLPRSQVVSVLSQRTRQQTSRYSADCWYGRKLQSASSTRITLAERGLLGPHFCVLSPRILTASSI